MFETAFAVAMVCLVTPVIALSIYVCNCVLKKITGYGIPGILESAIENIKNGLKALGLDRRR